MRARDISNAITAEMALQNPKNCQKRETERKLQNFQKM
jgi:hypothetical protein